MAAREQYNRTRHKVVKNYIELPQSKDNRVSWAPTGGCCTRKPEREDGRLFHATNRNREVSTPKRLLSNRLSPMCPRRYHSDAMRAKICTLVLVLLPALPLFSQAAGAQEETAQHSRQAQQFLAQHRPDLAIPEFKSLVALNPKNLDAQANLGVLLFFQGDYTQALPHLRAALDMQPSLTKIQALLGMAEKRTGQTAAASTDLEASFAAVTEPKLKIQIGMELVEMYTASRDLEKASGIVNAMRQADPLNPAVLYTGYRIYSDLASEAMLSLALVAPDSAQMHQVMAHEEARQGSTAAARQQFQKASEIDPKLPGIHFETGELLGISEDAKTRAAAEAEYKAALVENPTDEKAETRLGDLASRNGDAAQAIEHYDRALRLQPDDAEAEFGLAKTLIAMNQQAKALPVLERAVQLEPTNAAAHFRLSTIYREMGRTADSQHEVEEYKKYKMMKEKLEPIFKEMQLRPAGVSNEEQGAK
jgi:tetratricopeptide (TPR) repeat protein